MRFRAMTLKVKTFGEILTQSRLTYLKGHVTLISTQMCHFTRFKSQNGQCGPTVKIEYGWW